MKTFKYTAKDMAGAKITSTMQCEDYNDFLFKIHEKGLFCTSHQEIEIKESKSLYKFKTKDLAFCCRQLSAMMSSGLTLVKALEILFREMDKPAAKQVWREIYEDVQKGQSFSEALQIQKSAFPTFLISMVNAGESSVSLDIVMNRMSEHYAKENKMNNKIKGQMMYPIILSVLAVVLVIGMVTFILPIFAKMFDMSKLPPMTKALLGGVDLIKAYWYIALGVLAAIVYAIIYLFKIPEVKFKFDRFKIKAPMIGKLIVKVYTGRFARTLSSLYSSGIPMVECLERSSAVLGNEYITKCFETVVDEVKQGESLSIAIQRTDIFDSMFCSIIHVGEESGALDDILVKTSDYYEDEADSAIQKIVSLIEPLIIVFMGASVCLVLASIMPAMYSMFNQIK